jgi:hypothetical protein
MSFIRRYLTLQEFKQAEPEQSRRLFAMAKQVQRGFLADGGRRVPPWPRAVEWFCRMIQPDYGGRRPGADPLQVEHALGEYARKPEYAHDWPGGPWALMTHLANDPKASVRIEEVRWQEAKELDRAQAKGSLQRLGDLIPPSLAGR